MKIDEAITRYKNNAEYERTHGNLQGFLEFRQLYKWLKELRAYRQMYHKEHEDDCLRAEPFGNTYKDIDIAETIIEADREAKE